MDARPTSEEYLQRLLGFQTRDELIKFLNESDRPHPEPCTGGCGKQIVTNHPDGLCRRCDQIRRRMPSQNEAYAKAPLISKIIVNIFLGVALLAVLVFALIILWALEGALYRLYNHPRISSALMIAGVVAVCCFGIWMLCLDKIQGKAKPFPTWYEEHGDEEYAEF